MAEASADPRVGRAIGGYRLEAPIGRGGMGVVYSAQHIALQRRAAVKVIAPGLADTPGFRERFVREARVAAGLRHPNIVTVYDAGELDGELYLAMQYVDGPDLGAILQTRGRLPADEAVAICRQVASALDVAHAAGLIHRDVKPPNVLLEGATAYLTDFGLTKRIGAGDATLTRVGDVAGTLHYLAPEQVEGRPVDARTDVYALGCLLYHCLVGDVPFTRDSDVAVMYAHVSAPPPRISSARPELSGPLDAVIAKAMEKSPARRFATCSELVAAAAEAIEDVRRFAPAPRTVPVGGDAPDMATLAGRAVPARGDDLSVGTAVDRPTRSPAVADRPRLLLAGVDANARAVVHVAVAGRCDIDELAGGDELETEARERRPDVVLLGAGAPGPAPREVVQALRRDPLTRGSKVLLITDGRQRAAQDLLSAGADDALAAPFSRLQLVVKLRRLLGGDVFGG